MVSFYSPKNVRRLVLEIEKHLPDVPIIVIDNSRPLSPIVEERAWLDAKGIHRISVGPDLDHGQVIDLIRPMLIEAGYKSMVHVEPDCVVTSREWYDNLVGAIRKGAWNSSSISLEDGRFHPTPSAWSLKATAHLSWDLVPKGEEIYDRAYSWLVHDDYCPCPWLRKTWDTAQYAWYCCAREEKALTVPCLGFTHLWGGSYKSSLFVVPFI